MSLKTWTKEFMPTVAWGLKAKAAPVAHSLRKWQGLTPANLKKHGLKVGFYSEIVEDDIDDVFSDDSVSISDSTCALCQRYTCPMTLGEDACKACPLYIVRGGHSCTEPRPNELKSPFGTWYETENPKPMIKWLKKCVDKGYK